MSERIGEVSRKFGQSDHHVVEADKGTASCSEGHVLVWLCSRSQANKRGMER